MTHSSNELHDTTVGVFRTYDQAQKAIEDLKRSGYRDDQIGLIAKNEHGEEKSGLAGDPTQTRWEEGTGIGAAAGAATGTGLGLAVAAGLMTPIGPVIAGGALVALLASAGAGATVGTVVGGLVGLGVPEDDANYYENEVKSGHYVVTVKNDSNRSSRDIFGQHNAYDRHGSIAG